MRLFLVRSNELAWSGHAPSWADFITITRELEFSVHTGVQNPETLPSPNDSRVTTAHKTCCVST
jgi:hypothetical protein